MIAFPCVCIICTSVIVNLWEMILIKRRIFYIWVKLGNTLYTKNMVIAYYAYNAYFFELLFMTSSNKLLIQWFPWVYMYHRLLKSQKVIHLTCLADSLLRTWETDCMHVTLGLFYCDTNQGTYSAVRRGIIPLLWQCLALWLSLLKGAVWAS